VTAFFFDQTETDDEYQECHYDMGWWFRNNRLPEFETHVDEDDRDDRPCSQPMRYIKGGTLTVKLNYFTNGKDLTVYELNDKEFDISLPRRPLKKNVVWRGAKVFVLRAFFTSTRKRSLEREWTVFVCIIETRNWPEFDYSYLQTIYPKNSKQALTYNLVWKRKLNERSDSLPIPRLMTI